MSEKSVFLFPRPRRAALAGLTLLALLASSACLLPFFRTASARGIEGLGLTADTRVQNSSKTRLTIDYPEDGSIFPPGITPPTILWRDTGATSWHISITFADKSPSINALSGGQRFKFGPIDPRCIAATNKLPEPTAKQAASWVWTPDAAVWSAIQLHSKGQTAILTITGYRDGHTLVSESHIAFTTSLDQVGAPIFYRDVPLMPTQNTDGTVQPLASTATHLINWRLRDIRLAESKIVLTDVPTCLNCHSFSADGKKMGIDLDGPNNNKGLYAVVPTAKHITIDNTQVVKWNTDGLIGKVRVGFMSQISPDGKYVLSTFGGVNQDVPSTYYIRNFTDYRFLQVFYPTRGILEWYSKESGIRQPLPGADDPQYVQTDGVWSHDQKWIVFARAMARNPHEEGKAPANFANDPNETALQYDLYRIPFNGGKGGKAERIVGASEDGMSNNFPKISPDGRWIVFVKNKNGQLMRPDSKLYIIPFNGGEARPLRSNQPIMNSWHSWSPNGRWLVFSSKSRSPYTQMYLTHIDPDGTSSPAILIDNATASNRAVNLPEFVNLEANPIEDIKIPAIDLYRLMEQAMELQEQQKFGPALDLWKKAIAIDPTDPRTQNDLGTNLYFQGDIPGAFQHLREAIRINPAMVESHYNLGAFLLQQGHTAEALPELQKTLDLNPHFPSGEETLAGAYGALGKDSESLVHWHKALVASPGEVIACIGAARILSSSADSTVRNGQEALQLAQKANDETHNSDPSVLDTLGSAYAEMGQYSQALDAANRALSLAESKGDDAMANSIRYRIRLYQDNKPFRNQ
jgi:tetratricopeptide (TPR) repeat protein